MSNKENDNKERGIGDVIRKVVSIGVGAAFMTEDAVRNILGDLPIPKDVVSGLIQNAKGAKEEFLSSLREEIRNHLNKVKPQQLVEDLVENYDIEVKATFRFTRKDKVAEQEEGEIEEKPSKKARTSTSSKA